MGRKKKGRVFNEFNSLRINHFFFLLIILISFPSFSQETTHGTGRIPFNKFPNHDSISIVIDKNPKNPLSEKTLIHFYLVNKTPYKLLYSAELPNIPWWRLKALKNGSWEEIDVGWFCMNYLKPCLIKPNYYTIVDVKDLSVKENIKIGMDYLMINRKDTLKRTTWSKPFSVKK